MKKIVALILVFAMSFALFGCGKKEEKNGGSDKPKTEAQDDDKGGADAADAECRYGSYQRSAYGSCLGNGFFLYRQSS